MTEVLVAVLGGLSLVLVALVNRTRQHARAARDQVENSHTTNLRIEADERHLELKHDLHAIGSDLRGLRRDVGRLYDMYGQHESRLDLLQQVHPENGETQ